MLLPELTRVPLGERLEMADEVTVKCKCGDPGAFLGPLWAIGWLFTIGFLRLSLLKGILALAIWPYYLGVFLHK